MLTKSLSKTLKWYSLIIIVVCTLSIVVSKLSAADYSSQSKAEIFKASAAKQNKYTFIMFWKKKDQATSTMWKNLNSGLEGHSTQARITQVKTNDPTEANLVKKFGVSRAPMPMVLAIAPNGAVTGSFVRRFDVKSVDASFVSQTKSECMKALQDRQLVLLNVNPISLTGQSKAIEEFKAIPCYQKNTKIISLSLEDPDEASFLKELEIPTNSRVRNVVFMAPPGVLVGKYNGKLTKSQLIADLKKTGKGCGVEGCEHCK